MKNKTFKQKKYNVYFTNDFTYLLFFPLAKFLKLYKLKLRKT
jgi:hypothetical protein